MPSLIGPRLKIERAKKHIRDLDAAVRAFCDSEPYVLSTKQKFDISHIAFYVDSVQPIPNEIPLIVGDAVHNLRSAFDHLNCQLIEAGGGTPKPNSTFPICKTSKQYASAIGKGEIGKMRIGAEKLIRSIQPYETGDNTLWHIHALDRVDKHRLVLTVTMTTTAWGIDILGNRFMFPLIVSGPLIANDELVNIPVSTVERTGEKNFKLGLDISFGQSEILASKPVLETLNHMANFSDAIIGQFEPFVS